MHATVGILGFLAVSNVAHAAAKDECAGLTSLRLMDTTLTEAKTITAGDLSVPVPGPPGAALAVKLPAHCRVTGSIKPTADSDIRFELWLPTSGWNHRYEQVGNGGLAGSIAYFSMVEPLLRGSATASTDDGHVAAAPFDGSWAIGHPEKLVDYGHRAVHLTALAAQAIVAAYYGGKARHTYFTGCSDGGRESLMEAQRYPEDFDGYLVGAPGIDIPGNELALLHTWRALRSLQGDQALTPRHIESLTQKVLERCDSIDGIKDGVLQDPSRCDFKAIELVCKEANGAACLSRTQADAIQKIYDGPRVAATGQQLAPGAWGTLGAEATSWPAIYMDTPVGPSLIGFIARQGVINSDNPDLRLARRSGKKILHFHGGPIRISRRNTRSTTSRRCRSAWAPTRAISIACFWCPAWLTAPAALEP